MKENKYIAIIIETKCLLTTQYIISNRFSKVRL